MLAAAILKYTTFLGMAADVVLIKDHGGALLFEVAAHARRP